VRPAVRDVGPVSDRRLSQGLASTLASAPGKTGSSSGFTVDLARAYRESHASFRGWATWPYRRS